MRIRTFHPNTSRCRRVSAPNSPSPEELGDVAGVLCVENLLDLVRTGGEGPGSSIASFFLPYLERGELRLVGEVTAAELEACRRFLPGFAEMFQVVPIDEFDRFSALAVLNRLAASRSEQTGVAIGDGIVELSYHLFRRFLPYAAFPGQTTGFLGELFERAKREDAGAVDCPRVIGAFVRCTGLPELFLRDDHPLEPTVVLEHFQREVVGQEAACRAAADVVLAFKAGLNDPQRPLGVLLFCGPTGVGKTQLAICLSRYLFGHGDVKDRLMRLDMSEYSGYDAAERLLGRHGQKPSDLIQRVRQQPFVVVLLDEIEKASPEVFDVLLGLFDEGRLTDPYGRVTNFRSALVVMTSNLGAQQQQPLGFDPAAQPSYAGAVASFFRPEFFNRIDAVVNFQALSHDVILAITRRELADIACREGFVKSELRLRWSDALVEHLARVGFDARYGARPLQRALEAEVVAPLAHWLVEHADLRRREIGLDLAPDGHVSIACEFKLAARPS